MKNYHQYRETLQNSLKKLKDTMRANRIEEVWIGLGKNGDPEEMIRITY